MILTGIDHVVLRARDVERMVAFYTSVLGCSVERRQDEIGLIQLRAGSCLIDLVAVDGVLGKRGGPAPGLDSHNMDHLCLKVADFDVETVRAHLARHGVKIGETGSRYGSSGEGLSVYLEDDEGNHLELRA